ncbi:MAG: helix-turn-helix transcriptional regulator [Clostridiales bacterium]|nr:helix-turn-helix transcriptional regulator [Clostridiales bacterium]
MFNDKLFKAKAIEKGISMEQIAKYLGINVATLYRKINGSSDFSRSEIQQIWVLLALSASEINNIFFANKLT